MGLVNCVVPVQVSVSELPTSVHLSSVYRSHNLLTELKATAKIHGRTASLES